MLAATRRAGPPLWRTVVSRLGIAAACAGTGVAAAGTWLDGERTAGVPEVAMTEILVAARGIEPGARIVAADLDWRRWPVAAAADLTTRARGMAGFIGTRATARTLAGTPVTAALLARGGGRLAATIAADRRAISIAVTPAGGLAGFVAPGDRVDVLLVQAIGERRTSRIVLGDLAVLGVDQMRDDGGAFPAGHATEAVTAATGARAEPPGLVTLETDPGGARILALAAEMGKLSLILRSSAGSGRAEGSAAARTWDSDVSGLPTPRVPAPAAPSAAAPPPPSQTMQAQVGLPEATIVYGLPLQAAAK